MKKYIKIMRIDHWIKQLFIIPGFVSAIFIMNESINVDKIIHFLIAFLGVSMIASANYVLNEYLDKEFDKYHPLKKNRSLVNESVNKYIIMAIYILLAIIGIILGCFINKTFVYMQLFLLFMGIIYNVEPMRTKDIPILDVLSESINNVIRLLMGWFIVSANTLPPSSLILGYWFTGAFLMNTKRYSEYKMINNPKIAESYRKSFRFYTEKSLILISFFYAMLSTFFIGIFLIKYKIELLLIMPFFIGLFCYYFNLAFKEDSAVQKPEKLYKEKGLMLYCLLLIILFIILSVIEIPFIEIFLKNDIIEMW